MIRIIAMLCQLANPSACHERVVTTTTLSGVTDKACHVGMPQLAEFMSHFPQYSLGGWRCEPEEAAKKEKA